MMIKPKKDEREIFASFFRTVGVSKIPWDDIKNLKEENIDAIVKAKAPKKPWQLRATLTRILEQRPIIIKYEEYLRNRVKAKTPKAQIARTLGVKEETIKGHMEYLGIKSLSPSEAIRAGIKISNIKKGVYVSTKEKDVGGPYIPRKAVLTGVVPKGKTRAERLRYARMISKKHIKKKK